MPSTSLRSTLDSLASSFASEVLHAIRAASLDELLTETSGGARRGPGRPRATVSAAPRAAARRPPGRLARRSPEEIAKTLGLIVAAVKAKPMRAEQIRQVLKLDKRELPRVLAEGLKTKKLKSKGQKRATTYSVP
jgi:hypothetical protein